MIHVPEVANSGIKRRLQGFSISMTINEAGEVNLGTLLEGIHVYKIQSWAISVFLN